MIFFVSYILSFCTPSRPKMNVLINLFLYLYTKICTPLLLFNFFFLIVSIFRFQYCRHTSSAIFIPLYFVHYIYGSAAFMCCCYIFRTFSMAIWSLGPVISFFYPFREIPVDLHVNMFLWKRKNWKRLYYAIFRACLHETRSELKPVWDLTWG